MALKILLYGAILIGFVSFSKSNPVMGTIYLGIVAVGLGLYYRRKARKRNGPSRNVLRSGVAPRAQDQEVDRLLVAMYLDKIVDANSSFLNSQQEAPDESILRIREAKKEIVDLFDSYR